MPDQIPMPALRRARLAAPFLAVLLALQSAAGAPAAAADARQPAASTSVPSAARSIDSQLDEALQRRLRRAVGESHAPGMSMAIVTDDGRVWEGAAGTDRHGAHLRPRDAQTIASITKTFTATIAMQLVEEGKLELDVPASRYLPRVKLLRQVRVRQLLAHTSGIADLYGPVSPWLDRWPDRPLSSNDVLRSIGPNLFQPSKGYGYSNTNFYLLGLIVEAVTGQSFDEVLAERISEPLELEETRMLGAADHQLPPAWSSAFWASGGMVSTPAELAQFGQALYGGELLHEASRAQMTDFGRGHRYGLGTQLLPLGSRNVPGHSGLLYATTSLLVHLPKEGVTIAIFGTAPHTALDAALVRRYAGRSLVDLAVAFAR